MLLVAPGAMPIRLLLQNNYSFEPDEIANLVAAFEDALAALGLVRREDPATLLVAKTIFEAAKQGERDAKRLRDLAVKTLSK
jgi:hypothetical protein